MEGEWAYYAARSGLTPAQNYSLGDHQGAYWDAETAEPPTTNQDDSEFLFLQEQTGLTNVTVDDMNLVYWKSLSTLPAGLTADDYKHDVIKAG